MNGALVFDAIRTPRGKGRDDGGLHAIEPVELLKQLFGALNSRNGLGLAAIDDVVLGCVTQVGDQGANIAKVAALYAGLGDGVSGVTINRYCTSGLDACNFAAMKLISGVDTLTVGGGVECMSRVPMLSDKGSFYSDPRIIQAARFVPMGLAADLIASVDGITRSECDAHAVESQQRAARARDQGYFDASLIPISDPESDTTVSQDEIIRPAITVEKLARFEPAFAELASHYEAVFEQAFPGLGTLEFVHHRGNSPGVVDGASLVLFGTEQAGRELGLKPRARIRAMANASADELLALTGGIEAAVKVLNRAGIEARDIDLFEFNEAFAATTIKFPRDLGIDPEIVNANGGAIALGHAMGATGASLLGTLLDEMERRDVALGMVAVSGAAGIGTATIIERL